MHRSWIYKSHTIASIQECPEGAIGFIYKITGPDGRIYIGRKILISTRKTKISKKVKKETPTRKKFIWVESESNWLDYWGSCQELLGDIEKKGKDLFRREILEFCYCKAQMTYLEVKWMFHYNVLETNAYNGNILSKFFKTTPLCGVKSKING